jgi:hypothetical protein
MKEKQCACAKCRTMISDSIFEGIRFESDHVEEDYCVT